MQDRLIPRAHHAVLAEAMAETKQKNRHVLLCRLVRSCAVWRRSSVLAIGVWSFW